MVLHLVYVRVQYDFTSVDILRFPAGISRGTSVRLNLNA